VKRSGRSTRSTSAAGRCPHHPVGPAAKRIGPCSGKVAQSAFFAAGGRITPPPIKVQDGRGSAQCPTGPAGVRLKPWRPLQTAGANVFHCRVGWQFFNPLSLYDASSPGRACDRVQDTGSRHFAVCADDAGGSITGEHGGRLEQRCLSSLDVQAPRDLPPCKRVPGQFDPEVAPTRKLSPTPPQLCESASAGRSLTIYRDGIGADVVPETCEVFLAGTLSRSCPSSERPAS